MAVVATNSFYIGCCGHVRHSMLWRTPRDISFLVRFWEFVDMQSCSWQQTDSASVCAVCCVEELNTDCSVCLAMYLYTFLFYFLFFFIILSLCLSPFILPFYIVIFFRFFLFLSSFVSFILFTHFMHLVTVFYKYCYVFSVPSFFIS